jgi:hypothetical protein
MIGDRSGWGKWTNADSHRFFGSVFPDKGYSNVDLCTAPAAGMIFLRISLWHLLARLPLKALADAHVRCTPPKYMVLHVPSLQVRQLLVP